MKGMEEDFNEYRSKYVSEYDSDFINKESISYKELLELIELTEKASEKAENYKNKLFKLRLILVACISLLFISISYFLIDIDIEYRFNILFIISFIIIMVGVFSSTIILRQMQLFSKKLANERRNLSQLIEMTYELKNLNFKYNSLSIVEKTIIDIRLNQINFKY